MHPLVQQGSRCCPQQWRWSPAGGHSAGLSSQCWGSGTARWAPSHPQGSGRSPCPTPRPPAWSHGRDNLVGRWGRWSCVGAERLPKATVSSPVGTGMPAGQGQMRKWTACQVFLAVAVLTHSLSTIMLLFLFVCVCVCVHMHACVCMCTCMHVCVCVHACMHVQAVSF